MSCLHINPIVDIILENKYVIVMLIPERRPLTGLAEGGRDHERRGRTVHGG